jgi:hypothetical protein
MKVIMQAVYCYSNVIAGGNRDPVDDGASMINLSPECAPSRRSHAEGLINACPEIDTRIECRAHANFV